MTKKSNSKALENISFPETFANYEIKPYIPDIKDVYRPMRVSQAMNITEINYPRENPISTIAKKLPKESLSLLEKESKRKNYCNALEIGASIVNNLIKDMASKEKAKINEIYVNPEEIINNGLRKKQKSLIIKIKKD